MAGRRTRGCGCARSTAPRARPVSCRPSPAGTARGGRLRPVWPRPTTPARRPASSTAVHRPATRLRPPRSGMPRYRTVRFSPRSPTLSARLREDHHPGPHARSGGRALLGSRACPRVEGVMARVIHVFRQPDRFVAGTVGEPGDRSFYVQATEDVRMVSELLAATEDEIDESVVLGDAEEGPDALRVFLSPAEARAFAHRAERIVEAGT